MKAAQELLRLLTIAIPPTPAIHQLVLSSKGQLAIVVFFGDAWQSYILDEKDLEKSPEEIVATILKMHLEMKPSDATPTGAE